MSSKKPIVGLIFLIGLGLVTAGAGFYTVLLPIKTSCVAAAKPLTVNVTIHQWYFEINGTDATKNGWSICHGSTIIFMIRGMWEHNADIGMNLSSHGFYIAGIAGFPSSGFIVSDGQVITTPPLTFNLPPGDINLVCTIPCGSLAGFGGHPIRTTIHVL